MQVNKEENDQIRRDLKDTKKDFDDLEANNVSFNNRLLFVTDDVVIACSIHFLNFILTLVRCNSMVYENRDEKKDKYSFNRDCNRQPDQK